MENLVSGTHHQISLAEAHCALGTFGAKKSVRKKIQKWLVRWRIENRLKTHEVMYSDAGMNSATAQAINLAVVDKYKPLYVRHQVDASTKQAMVSHA